MEFYVIRNKESSHKDDWLMHHGVKGMKWGVRKDENDGGSKSSSRKDKSSDSGVKRASAEYEAEVAYNSQHNQYPSGSTQSQNSGKTSGRSGKSGSSGKSSEGYVESKTGLAKRNETKQAQNAKRETKSGVWKQSAISSRILDENSRQAHINQGDFSPWYGGSYQEIREDLSPEELMDILMKALDEDVLSKDSDNPAYWVYQLGDDLKFYVSDADKTARKYVHGRETANLERQVWNELMDELSTNPAFKEQFNKLRGEIAMRKLETYMLLENNTPHVKHPNGAKESGKAKGLSDSDFDALTDVGLSRWSKAPVGAHNMYINLKEARARERAQGRK